MMSSWIACLHLTLLTFMVLVFTQAALHKASDLRRFSGYIANYSPKLDKASMAIATALLGAEIAAVLMSISAQYTDLGAGLMLILLACYTSAMWQSLKNNHREIDCGCGGTPVVVSRKTIVRNSVLAALTGLILVTHYQALNLAELLVALMSGCVLWLGYFLVEQLLHNQDSLLKLHQASQEKEF
ncbi:Methylamine utilisation protein MauE [Vibrio xiamenensis]|uniref:Methylamine utilization protein MauE n=1 Tax=Vibrio xiamenensis TaxID=861298 RepID=A0A1G8AP07_9VIBR|nr:MauE/DoxX family redox-associated membrane protein [Vibrio xiamenensis]SDH22496.1 Methylamine utilisation protein MauE [Vibrio xiamenensis]